MKLLNLFVIVCVTAVSTICAEQDHSENLVKPIQEIEVEGLNFNNLPKESQTGDLKEVVGNNDERVNPWTNRIKMPKVIMHPNAETVAYVNGQLCHIGNYPQSVIYTVLEGPNYGTQTTMTYDGIILYVNYEFELEHTFGGVVLHHFYADSKIITGSNQVIKFKR